MTIKTNIQKHCRTHGGLFLGIRYTFPVTHVDELNLNKSWQHISISIGFIFFTVNFNINYAFKDE